MRYTCNDTTTTHGITSPAVETCFVRSTHRPPAIGAETIPPALFPWLAVWLGGWLSGCLAVWLSGCLAVWLSVAYCSIASNTSPSCLERRHRPYTHPTTTATATTTTPIEHSNRSTHGGYPCHRTACQCCCCQCCCCCCCTSKHPRLDHSPGYSDYFHYFYSTDYYNYPTDRYYHSCSPSHSAAPATDTGIGRRRVHCCLHHRSLLDTAGAAATATAIASDHAPSSNLLAIRPIPGTSLCTHAVTSGGTCTATTSPDFSIDSSPDPCSCPFER